MIYSGFFCFFFPLHASPAFGARTGTHRLSLPEVCGACPCRWGRGTGGGEGEETGGGGRRRFMMEFSRRFSPATSGPSAGNLCLVWRLRLSSSRLLQAYCVGVEFLAV